MRKAAVIGKAKPVKVLRRLVYSLDCMTDA